MIKMKVNLGEIKEGIHYFPVRVYYNHTDAGGIVYFANYLRMTEEARVAMFSIMGAQDKEAYKELQQTGDFVVRSCNVEYLKSAFLNDDLVIVSKVIEVSKTYIILSQDIFRNDEKLVEVKFKLVFVKKLPDGIGHRVSRVPEFWLNKIKTP